MKVLFHLGHPAHYHLFKNSIINLKKKGHSISIVIKKKDILEALLTNDKIEFKNILPSGRKDNKLSIALGQIKQDIRLLIYCLKFKPDVLIGTSVATAHVSKIIKVPCINCNEDDAEVVPLYAKLSYPFSDCILAPTVCSVGKWVYKKVSYSSYHELAYLHPNHFSANEKIVAKYVKDLAQPYFIIRFAKLGAHHDKGIHGIDNAFALTIVKKLCAYGQVVISSERVLSDDLEDYRMAINPIHMHDLLAFSALFIGDSQTMAAEAGVLGVPFIRYNDFVGRISYLDELENKYELGYGVRTSQPNQLLRKLDELLQNSNRKSCFAGRREKMLTEKIDYAAFLTWFIENYPESKNIMNDNPDYQYRFR